MLSMVTSGTLPEADEREKTLGLVSLLLEGGALEDAAALIYSGLAKNPEDPAFRVAQARWLFSSGQLRKARTVVDLLLSLPDPPADALWLSGRLQIVENNFPEAIDAFQRLLAIDPDPPAALLKELATACALNGMTEEAETTFHRALEKDPLLAGAHTGLGSLLESTRRLEEAAKLLRRSVVLNPATALLRRNLARALQRLGKAEEAEAELEKARQIEAWQNPRSQ